MRNVEIRKVSNGFVVLPPYNGSGSFTDGSEISVFETFDALTEFLRKTLADTDASKRDTST